nr:hypothetical protein [Tanacetum cinerariifolium]
LEFHSLHVDVASEYQRVCDMRHALALDFASRESQTSAILAAIEVEIEDSLDGLSLYTDSL